MATDLQAEARLLAGLQLCVAALRAHSDPDSLIDEALETLAAAAGHGGGHVVLVRGSPSEVVDRLGTLVILVASHAIGIQPVEDEFISIALLHLRAEAEALVYRIEESA